MKSGQVVAQNQEGRLAIVAHPDGSCCVLQWAEEHPLCVGDRVVGAMSEGGWTRLMNDSTGFTFRAYRHLYGCPRRDAFEFCRPDTV
jgi:hypothetical protein